MAPLPTPSLLCLLLCLLGAPAGDAQPLFDGASLDGWVTRGGPARYTVIDETIVGEAVPRSRNTFLCTERTYGDFVLELEVKTSPGLNSGVQIRSEVEETDGRERIFGYQVEVDPSPRAWSGGLYDEGRRGWLDDLSDNEPARRAFRPGDWNAYRIEAIGDRIRTWVNGVPAADYVDATTLEGFIGLQVHGVGELPEPKRVEWRNLRLEELGRSRWEPLFDGQTLDGFSLVGGGRFSVEDGRLVGTHEADDPAHGVLLWDEPIDDVTVRAEVRITRGNSGLYFRCEPTGRDAQVDGFQAEIDPIDDVGGLYETGGRGWVAKPSAAACEAWRADGWNVLTVHAHGARLVTHVNGVRAVELVDAEGRRRGQLGLQLHGGQDVRLELRAVERLVSTRSF